VPTCQPTPRLNRPGHGNPARIQADVQRRKSDKNGPIDRHHTLEIRLLSFSTNQPRPLAEQPIIFISSKSLILDLPSVRIKIVGDYLALHITFLLLQDASDDMFFLVVWIKGEVHCVSHSQLFPSLIIKSCLSSCAPPNGVPMHTPVSSPRTPSSFPTFPKTTSRL
jgi:hypothetical protein